MSDEIKSAYERAMERVERLGKPSDEEILKWKYEPEGESLAVRYLKGEAHLIAELSNYDEMARKYVGAGALRTLLKGIDVPYNEQAKRTTRLSMEGIKALKDDKAAVENVFSKMRRIFTHYEGEGEQQRSQAREQLKRDFEVQLQQAIQQQFGSGARVKADAVEQHPQFQEEWRRVLAQLDSQYQKLIEESKQEIESIP